MSQGYPSTIILEANRRSSEEFKSGNKSNPALFTNKVNDGMRVNRGDVISVHSAYISELGAEGSEIEIKGVDLGASKDVIITETTHNSQTLLTNTEFDNREDELINGYILNSINEKTVNVKFRDDTIQMVSSPYKNANGEHYIPLPFNFAVGTRTNATTQLAWLDPMLTKNNTSNTFGSLTNGNISLLPREKTWNRTDKMIYFPSTENFPQLNVRNDNSRFAIFQIKDVIHTYGLPASSLQPAYTLGLQGIKWGVNGVGDPLPMSSASYVFGDRQDNGKRNIYPDIALQPYVRVRNLITAQANPGYNSPSDVSEKITEDLLRTEEITRRTYQKTQITTYAENQVNKLYKCASPQSFSAVNASNFFNWNYVSGDPIPSVVEYISAYETIGIKRPDLYEQGQKAFHEPFGQVVSEQYERDSSTQLMRTDLPWTSDNLKNISDLIDIQQRYPELLDSSNLNAEDSNDLLPTEAVRSFSIKDSLWFLHMNISASNASTLGYDLNDVKSVYFETTAGQGTQQPSASMATAPIFLSYNPLTRDKTELQVDGSNFQSAVYGFAIKETVTTGSGSSTVESYYISVKVAHLYKASDVSRIVEPTRTVLDYIPKGTRIGWDRHFTAYGVPCILLWNGMNSNSGAAYEEQGQAVTVDTAKVKSARDLITLGDKVPYIYLGAPEISLAFSQITDRFEWRNLHTPEKTGNLYNAGFNPSSVRTDTNTDVPPVVTWENPDSTPVPPNPNSDVNVYKINKQLLENNWSPQMVPYHNVRNASFYTRFTEVSASAAFYTATQTFAYLNEAFDLNTIFDSNCGIFITDWVVDEKNWDNSLWGIMGFQYSQTTGSAGNQTRVINSNDWSSMAENTTNADITNEDFTVLTRNQFGSANYNLTPPTQTTPVFYPFTGNASDIYVPTISVTVTTGQVLRALNIPTRTLRPYYTIRSNIINGKSSYYGGSGTGVALPVVAVVDKVSNSGDFFNIDNNDLTFTATQPYTLSDITTSICDPDGTYSKLSANSAVLYRIQRQIPAQTEVVESILQEYKTNKEKQAFEQSLDPPITTPRDIKGVLLQMQETE